MASAIQRCFQRLWEGQELLLLDFTSIIIHIITMTNTIIVVTLLSFTGQRLGPVSGS